MTQERKGAWWLFGVASAAIMLASASPSHAQSTDTEDEDGAVNEESVVVIGQRAMMQSAISRQRQSNTVESVITRDAIGQFPDQNVAEAIRRVTGVNILNDQGEGRFVSVRGLDPSLNAASLNGVRLPSPEADTRAIALDVFASELVESIQIKKTLTPDMDADTIGASIEINTTRAFDRDDVYFGATIEGSYNDLNGELSPKGSIDFSIPVSDNFGISGGLSFYDRTTSTDNQEMDDWSEQDGFAYAETVEYRDYDVQRERLSGSLSFDWRASSSTDLYARLIYSQFDDTEERRRLIFDGIEDPISVGPNTATFVSGPSNSGDIAIRRDIKDRFESQIIQSYQVGGETEAGPWNFRYQLAYSEAEEHEHRTTDPTRFEYEAENDGELGFTFDYSNLETTTFSVIAGTANFLDTSNYELDERADVDGLAKDEEVSGRFDFSRAMEFGAGDFTWAGGLKFRLREKSYTNASIIFDGFDGDYTLSDVAGTASYGLFDLGPMPDLNLTRAFNSANLAGFEVNDDDTLVEQLASAYVVEEDIFAGYLMGTWETDRMTIIGGVRVEKTEDDLSGFVLDEDVPSADPISFSNSYTDVLPSLNLKYEFSDDVVLRAAATGSISRPGIGQLAPRFNTNEDLELEAGNPELDPYRAWNFDLSAEYYFAPTAVIQIGVFYKDIQDFIVTREFDAGDAPYLGVYNGVAFEELTIPLNGGDATVAGVEFNYQQALDFLPGPWDGLLVGFNYTYTDTEGDIGARTIPLPASAANTYNAMLGYEKGPVSLRLTASYRDRYLDELGGEDDGSEDRYVQDHLQVDASAKYRVNDQFQVFAEFVNLNDEPYLAYNNFEGAQRLLQFETYSWTGKFGLRYTY